MKELNIFIKNNLGSVYLTILILFWIMVLSACEKEPIVPFEPPSAINPSEIEDHLETLNVQSISGTELKHTQGKHVNILIALSNGWQTFVQFKGASKDGAPWQKVVTPGHGAGRPAGWTDVCCPLLARGARRFHIGDSFWLKVQDILILDAHFGSRCKISTSGRASETPRTRERARHDLTLCRAVL